MVKVLNTPKGKLYMYNQVSDVPANFPKQTPMGIKNQPASMVRDGRAYVVYPVASSPYVKTLDGRKIPRYLLDQFAGMEINETTAPGISGHYNTYNVTGDNPGLILGKSIPIQELPKGSVISYTTINLPGDSIGSVGIAPLVVAIVIVAIVAVAVLGSFLMNWLTERSVTERVMAEAKAVQHAQDMIAEGEEEIKTEPIDYNNDGIVDQTNHYFRNGDIMAEAQSELGYSKLGGPSKLLQKGYDAEDVMNTLKPFVGDGFGGEEESSGISPGVIAGGAAVVGTLAVGTVIALKKRKDKKGKGMKTKSNPGKTDYVPYIAFGGLVGLGGLAAWWYYNNQKKPSLIDTIIEDLGVPISEQINVTVDQINEQQNAFDPKPETTKRYGCTDSNALNYDPDPKLNHLKGSCIYAEDDNSEYEVPTYDEEPTFEEEPTYEEEEGEQEAEYVEPDLVEIDEERPTIANSIATLKFQPAYYKYLTIDGLGSSDKTWRYNTVSKEYYLFLKRSTSKSRNFTLTNTSKTYFITIKRLLEKFGVNYDPNEGKSGNIARTDGAYILPPESSIIVQVGKSQTLGDVVLTDVRLSHKNARFGQLSTKARGGVYGADEKFGTAYELGFRSDLVWFLSTGYNIL